MPILELLTFIFLNIIFEFLDNNVRTIKKALELISPGTIYLKPLKLDGPLTSIKSYSFFFFKFYWYFKKLKN